MRYKLGEVAKIRYGKDHKKLDDGNIPVYGSGGIMRYVDTALYDKKSVLIPRKGSLGNLFFVNKPFWTVDTLFYTEIDENILMPEFLFYKLKMFNLASMNVGSAVPSLTTAILNALELDIPSFEVQSQIVNILKAFDERISLNKQINHHLEQIARSIFKSWFVDFNPFGGDVPASWNEEPLFDLATVTYGKNLPTKKLLSSGYRVFGGNGQIGYYSEYLYKKERILISCRGAASGTVRLSRPYSFVTNNSLIVNEKEPELFAYLKEWSLNRQFFDAVTGSAQPQVTVDSLKLISLPKPDKETLEKFTNLLMPIYNEIEANTTECEKLVILRDTLLPKLMTGEISVTD